MVTLSGLKTAVGSPSDLASLRLDHHIHQQQQQYKSPKRVKRQHHLHQQQVTCSTLTSNATAKLEEEGVFENLILKETSELERRQVEVKSIAEQLGGCEQQLDGQLRHSLLSWMLKVCEHQLCQDDVFPLATLILDKFLLLRPQLDHLSNKPQTTAATTTTTTTTTNTTTLPIIERHILAESQSSNMDTSGSGLSGGASDDSSDDGFHCDEDELNLRQLVLFAACSLLLASKLRQTPRLSIAALSEFSRDELPIELKREELLDGEMCILHTLRWDLASLVTPNDYLSLLVAKCGSLWSSDEATAADRCHQMTAASQLAAASATSGTRSPDGLDIDVGIELSPTDNNSSSSSDTDSINVSPTGANKLRRGRRCDESRVRRHTQTLLELCLMDSHLSRYPPSILAMSTMAVAIDGLSMTEKTCWRLEEIVAEIHEATHKVNELKPMIDVAFQIEKYVQKLLNSLT